MRILLILLLLIPTYILSQEVIIKNGLYETKYSYDHKSPIWVKYELYKGGGDCNRSKFKLIELKGPADNDDFVGSGFDKGHLVPAEDFAYDCELEKKTFYMYNVVAQYPNSNRGVWSSYEKKVRKLSQYQRISIQCGCFYGANKINNSISIPTSCWKIVRSMDGKVLISVLITNDKEINSVKKVPYQDLIKRIEF